MIKTKETIKDIIATAFCDVYERISEDTFVLNLSLEAYFLKACKNALWGKSKEYKRKNRDKEWQESTFLPKEEYITPEKEQFFQQYILPKLSKRKRRILELTYEGCSNQVIAEKLNNNVNAIKVAKSQALKEAKEIATQFPDFFRFH